MAVEREVKRKRERDGNNENKNKWRKVRKKELKTRKWYERMKLLKETRKREEEIRKRKKIITRIRITDEKEKKYRGKIEIKRNVTKE